MYLFFDTETTGLPRYYNVPLTDLDNWPRMVQLAYEYYDEAGNLIDSKSHIIRPEGYEIPAEVARIHRITTERAMEEGEDLGEVLNIFLDKLKNATYLIAHNIRFDEKIIGAEFLRKEIGDDLSHLEKRCTMQESTDYCAIPGKRGYKWPNLMELHTKLFDEGFDEAHDALADVRACAKCFFELKRRGVL